MIINSVSEYIGKTPLLKINDRVHSIPNLKLYAKLELFNPDGSLKDRIAKNMLQNIGNKPSVIESSSGNTAKALAGLCCEKGLTFKTVTNRIKHEEIKMILQVFGSDIIETPGHSECPDPNDPNDPLQLIAEMEHKNPDLFHTDQYHNYRNIEAHEETGNEILQDLDNVHFFFGYLGTCGSTRGIGKILRENFSTKVIGIVTAVGEYVPGGRTESELFETGFFDRKFYSEIVKGSTQSSIDGMLELVRKCGIPCGPTSGLAYSKIKEYFKENPLQEETIVVFIICDRLEQYTGYLKKYRPSLFGKTEEPSISIEEVMDVPEVDPSELKQDDLIIDTRGSFSYELGSIPESINISGHFFEDMILEGASFQKNKRIILVCPTGIFSRKYAALMRKSGHNACSLKGGYEAYKKKFGK